MSDKYIVSARKYRPSTFRSVVGQQSLTHTLKTAIASGRLAHAYLFCGPRGVGKTTCARIFAKTINCEHPTPEGEACNECPSCKAFNEQRSYNINELDAASNNSVDNIRDLTEQVRIPPQTGRYRVFIIDEVHMLSQAAFNAFLKTLEEPPDFSFNDTATTENLSLPPPRSRRSFPLSCRVARSMTSPASLCLTSSSSCSMCASRRASRPSPQHST